MRRDSVIWLLSLFVLTGCYSGLNGYDKEGRRHGRYLAEWEEGIPMQKGRFRHGSECGKWKHFDISGNLVKTEKYFDNQILTRHFRENGTPESEGIAYLYFDEGFARYSREGVWHYYKPDGCYGYSVNFVRGQAVDTLSLQTSKFIYHERSAR